MYRELITDVFFDLDHTLWDFERNSALTFEKIFIDHGVDVKLDDFLAEYVPVNLEFWKLYREDRIGKEELRYQRLRKVFDAVQYPIEDAVINRLAHAYIEQLSNHGHLLPYTREILDYLRPHYKMHIITNGFEEVQEKKLRNAGISDYFDQMINSEMAGVKKPNPIIFQLALNRTRVLPQHAIMVGDNLEADILGARALGIHTIHLNVHADPLHKHGEIIHDLSEIKSFL
ncbi:MAG: YjjG family noncanonical pyrimidine nucleotidase [Muriicola sp.]|nr:YjjG family noncanonical pyrimidine nucleotidase [Muriicola sp.]NNK10349.1 noncanonical pyrimidine nucleotidase, YjjG family [Flavobacteriaceae bacterium]